MRHQSLTTSEHRHPSAQRTPFLKRILAIPLAAALLGYSGAQAQSFQDISAGLAQAYFGTIAWGDYDMDSRLDLLLTGNAGGSPFADIYRNNNGSFVARTAGLAPVSGGISVNRSAWGDYDNDGDLDVVVIGKFNGNPKTLIYQNNAGTFTVAFTGSTPLTDVSDGAAAWGDYDNDGDLDLFLSGTSLISNTTIPVTTVYRNDGFFSGSWRFTDLNQNGDIFTPVMGSDGAWGDYDRDGDLDLVVIGTTSNNIPQLSLYRNNGEDFFTPATATGLPSGVTQGSIAWGDYDNDGWLDLAISGFRSTPPFYPEIYRNNGNRTFSRTAIFNSSPQINGSVAWGDCNNDGRLDLLVTGFAGEEATILLGNASNSFDEDNDATLPVMNSSSYSYGSWGDYDNDGRLDIAISGWLLNSTSMSRIYRNTNGAPANTPPSAPTGVTATLSSRSMSVRWDPSTDAETPQGTLSYNLSIKNLTTGTIVMSPMADLATGKRYLPAIGNTNHLTTWAIGDLTPGHSYQICVQAIDQAFEGSPFTCALTVTLPQEDADVMIGDCPGDIGAEPNPACGLTVINYWNSPNIYIRHQADGHLPMHDVMQRPSTATGATNYVYARLRNISTETMPGGKVQFYFTKASTGAAWPTHWNGYVANGVVMGDFIGEADVPSMAPGATHYAKVLWENLPPHLNNPNDHTCLVARFISASDPLYHYEVPSVYDNASKNNNIAWRNISDIDYRYPKGDVIIRNPGREDDGTGIRIVMTESELGTLIDHATLWIRLPWEIFQRWDNNGRQGEGVTVVEDESGEQMLQINSPDAMIEGIDLGAGEEFTATVQVLFPASIPDALRGQYFYFDLIQYRNGSDDPVGGETYSVEMGTAEAGKMALPGKGDLSMLLGLSAQPNPMRSTSTISYRLPEPTGVQLSLYDAAGKLVRTLVAGEQNAGAHEIEWDGRTDDGEAVPSGAYFYRLETADGIAQGQIRITR